VWLCVCVWGEGGGGGRGREGGRGGESGERRVSSSFIDTQSKKEQAGQSGCMALG
jgi:hypothetical protein